MTLFDLRAFGRCFSALSHRVSRSVALTRIRAVCFASLSASAVLVAASAQSITYTDAIQALNTGSYTTLYATGAMAGPSGNVYLCDFNDGQVLVLSPSGAVSVLATPGITLAGPAGVWVDSQENVLIADAQANQIDKVTAAGVASVVATPGYTLWLPRAVGEDAQGNIYIGDFLNERVLKVTPGGTVTVLPSGVYALAPLGFAFDSTSDIYIGDYFVGLLKIDSSNNVTQVSTGSYSFAGVVWGVALDSAGNLYVTDQGNDRILVIAPGGNTTILNLDGYTLNNPQGLSIDKYDNLYISDQNNSRYLELSLSSAPFRFRPVNVGATSSATLDFTFSAGGTIKAPVVLTQGATGLDFTDAGTGSCTTNGTAHTYNSGDTCTVTVNFKPQHPGQRLGAVELLNSTGAVITTVDISGTGVGPQITFSPATQSTLGGGFNNPEGVAVDASGNVFVADFGNSAVKEILAVNGQVSSSSTVITVGSGFSFPSGVAVDGAGDVFVADFGNSAVKEIVAGTGGAASGQLSSSSTVITVGSGFSEPVGVAVDGAGDVFVADQDYPAVKEIVAGTGGAASGQLSSSSTVITVGSGFSYPAGVVVDGAGDVFVADQGNLAVKEILAVNGQVSSSSTVNTLGSGFSLPASVAVDGAGDVFVADFNNSAVYELNFATAPTLNFPSTVYGSTSAAQTVTVSNIGNAALSWAGFAYPTDFTAQNGAGACANSSTLASGADCLLPIAFYPQSGGSFSESITLTDNNLNVTGAQQTITVTGTATKAPQTITFPPPVSGPAALGAIAALTATSTSGLPVGYLSRTPSICFLVPTGSSWDVRFAAYGECSILAYQWGNATYSAAAQVAQSFYIHGVPQTITVAPITGTVTVGDSVSISATSSAFLPVSFASKTPTICTVSSTAGSWTLAAAAKGVCTLVATQPGDSVTTPAAAPVAKSIPIHGKTQSITFPALPSGLEVGSAFVTLNATASSGLPVSYASTRPAYCTVTESAGVWTVNLLKAGGCSIVAEQSGNSTYASAPSVNQNFYINAAR